VTCFQTIEHVYEPLELVRDMHRILRPGGTAFLVGHDVEALSARILGAKSPIFDIEHMQLFNRRSAAVLMREAGFTDIRVSSISNSYPLSYWAKLFPLPDAFKAAVLSILTRTLPGVGRMMLALPAGNLAVLATK
jgi:SAM-dependent methyltransferase